MKVLVVGGAGYLGCVLVNELLERGYAVRVFDRLFFGEGGLHEVRDRLELMVGDVRQMDPAVLEGVDAVINLAGLSNDPTAEYNPQANYQMNTVAAESLARLCQERGIRRHVLASSCSIYDVGVGTQEKDILLDEDSPVAPKAAYSSSKYLAEKAVLGLKDPRFSPVVLRMGTLFGFSPRMRYDLVINTFVKDVLSRGHMTLFYGGEMWRPLVAVKDAARAYILCLEAPEEKVSGQIFNVVYDNLRISEASLRVRETFTALSINAQVKVDYSYRGIRNYRVSGKKILSALEFKPLISIEDAVRDMVAGIAKYHCDDFDSPRHYNIRWMQLLEEADHIVKLTGYIFDLPEDKSGKLVRLPQARSRGK